MSKRTALVATMLAVLVAIVAPISLAVPSRRRKHGFGNGAGASYARDVCIVPKRPGDQIELGVDQLVAAHPAIPVRTARSP